MSGKFMRTRRIVIPTLTLLLIASQLSGCGATDKTGALQLLRDNGEAIEIEVAEPANSTGQVELSDTTENSEATWSQLASLTNASDIRKSWEDTLLISGTTGNKNGVLYVDSEGNQDNNNTLLVALHNRAFTTQLEDKATAKSLAQAVSKYYADEEVNDLSDDVLNLLGINAYFNLIDDEQDNYATPNDTLTRLQFYSMVYKAITPATDISESDSDELNFTESVGSYSTLNYFASKIESKAYINTSDKSLNEKTVGGSISRGEAIYLLMNTLYPDELANVDTSNAKLDCKPQTATFDKEDGADGDTYLDSYRAQVSFNNQDEYGCKDEIYKALVLANQKGIIGTETRYDEAITKVEALQLLVDAIESSNSIDKFNYKNGKTTAQATTAVTEAAEAEKAELEADLAKAESESIDPFAGQEVSVDGDFTFAADVDPADKAQILKARDEAGLDASDCDTNGDGLIDKDEAADAAFLFDDEVIADANDFAESIKKSLEDELMQEIESSSSSSESTTGTGKVETWTADPGTTPQIDFSTPIDHSDLEKGVTVY